MLERVLVHIHNRFERSYASGTWTIEGGELPFPPALDGQYVWIEGSVFNDGLHQCPMEDLEDETFTGRIVLLAIPKALLDLVDEIEDWQDRNGQVADGPYQSESFGGYSYTRGASGSADSGSTLTGWQAHFSSRLIPWRKLS